MKDANSLLLFCKFFLESWESNVHTEGKHEERYHLPGNGGISLLPIKWYETKKVHKNVNRFLIIGVQKCYIEFTYSLIELDFG